MKRLTTLAAIACAVLVAGSAAWAGVSTVEMEWSNVGDPGNAASGFGLGAVDARYAIGTFEVTNAQYTEFLNAVADKDTKGLYNTKMAGTANKKSNPQGIGGITRAGKSGKFTYAVKAGWGDLPVSFVGYNDALRFVNWMAKGQPSGAIGDATTEKGVYDMKKSTPTKAADAAIWLPSENEWFKAAYYKGGGPNAGYWGYATGANAAPAAAAPAGGPNSANYRDAVADHLNQVGAYDLTASAYGVQDMNGNVWEWTDSIYGTGVSKRVFRGGGFDSFPTYLGNAYRTGASKSSYEAANLGFRVAGLFDSGAPVPEPATMVLLALGGVGLLRRKRE